MKSLAVLLISILLVGQPCLADDVKFVRQGEPSPFTGYLFSVEKEKELRLLDQKLEFANMKVDLLKKSNELQNEMLTISAQRSEMYKTNSDSLSKQLADHKSDNFWKNTLYFSLGAVLSGVVAYGVSRSVR